MVAPADFPRRRRKSRRRPPAVILSSLLGSALLTFMQTKWPNISIAVLVSASLAQGQDQGKRPSFQNPQVQALRTLNRYVQLRLEDADWKEYSKLITWPDEPSWDCKWLVNRYSVGAPTEAKGKVLIPVAYNRLGLYCDNFYFEPGQKTTTIRYELVRREREWRIDGPTPDYPDVGADVLVSSLEATARNPNETPEKRAKAETMAHKIIETLHALRKVPR